jgi:hypothetical protein
MRILANRDRPQLGRGRCISIPLILACCFASSPSLGWAQTNSTPATASSQPSAEPETAPAAALEYEARLLQAYGAVLKAGNGVILPPAIQFANEDAVTNWQAGIPAEKATIGGVTIELQTPAMQALLAAREDLQKIKLDVRPARRDAARRSFADTERLWKQRVEPGLYHWYKRKKISRQELRRLRALPHPDQAMEILQLEARGLFFSTNLKKSILASAAPPGASQHLTMLALDIRDHEKARVREALARHGWFQTVAGDFGHFTYLGCREEDLPGLGLSKVLVEKRAFWVPVRLEK